MLVHPEPTGVGTYGRELYQSIERLVGSPEVLHDRLQPTSRSRSAIDTPVKWLRAMWPFPRRARSLPGQEGAILHADDVFRIAQVHFDMFGRLLRLRIAGPPGLFHWTYPLPIIIDGWVNLYTVHDLIPLLRPELSPIDPARLRRMLGQIVLHASGLITVSEASSRDIVETLGVPPQQVRNCGQAIEPAPAQVLPPEFADKPFLLVIGTVEKRKNIERICDAFHRSGSTFRLIVAGPDGGAEVKTGPGDIRRLRHIPQALASALIAHAQALLMPSLAEGFGLPIIEAMAAGTPVITSHGGATEEVAGGAALLVNPLDIECLIAAIRRISNEATLRANLSTAGLRAAARFAPARFDASLAAAYREFGKTLPSHHPQSSREPAV